MHSARIEPHVLLYCKKKVSTNKYMHSVIIEADVIEF